jgi:membrane-bound serine protease (ClpP class)
MKPSVDRGIGRSADRNSARSKFAFWAIATALLLLLLVSIPARADIVKITIDGPIQAITDEYIGRAVDEAERTHADALLIQLRTPGGFESSTREIIQKILASKVPVIIYVAPGGARAASAGFFILQSADVAAMAPGTNTGAAHPVLATGGKMDDIMKMKVENDSAALMRSVVSKRGRNVEVAESAVRESKSWSDEEALKLKLIDVVAKDETDLFKQLEGRPIKRFDGTTVKLDLAGKAERPFEMTLKQNILNFLMDPNIAFILLSVGMMAVYIEFNHPGAVVPGVVGLFCVLLAVFAFNLLPTRFAGVAMIVAALALFVLEAKLATHGVLGVSGVVMMTLGAMLLVDGPIPELRVKLVTALAVSIPFGVITVFLLSIAIRARRNKVATGAQGLIGIVGVAQTPLSPEGKVFVHGEVWNAIAESPVELGEQVEVRRVDGLTVYVAPLRAGVPSAPTTVHS